MKITNVPEANQFLTREYRPGWELWKIQKALWISVILKNLLKD